MLCSQPTHFLLSVASALFSTLLSLCFTDACWVTYSAMSRANRNWRFSSVLSDGNIIEMYKQNYLQGNYKFTDLIACLHCYNSQSRFLAQSLIIKHTSITMKEEYKLYVSCLYHFLYSLPTKQSELKKIWLYFLLVK